jgi:uncharacterized protein
MVGCSISSSLPAGRSVGDRPSGQLQEVADEVAEAAGLGRVAVVSLTVSDVARSLAFYRDGLGFPTHNYADGDVYIMFRLEGSWLSIIAREEMFKDLPAGAAVSFSSVALSHNVASEEAVRAVFEQGLAAGATAIKSPRPAPWGGYEAAFADPDGHVWDIAMNPFTDLT